MVDPNGATTATSTGGMVTAMNSDDYQNSITTMNVDLTGVTAGFMAEADTVTIGAGQSEDHGDIALSCAAGRYDCEVMVMVHASDAITATSTGGTVTAMNSDDYQDSVTPMNVDLADVTDGFMAEADTVTIMAGQSEDYGDIAFSCGAGARDCEVVVMVDANDAITATSTGGTVTAKNSDAYQEALTTRDVSLSDVTDGFMAEATEKDKPIQIEEGESVVHGDVAFSCAAGRYDCVIMVSEDSSGTITATKTGGTVTAMDSDDYNTRIQVTNEADSIHAVTGIDVVRENRPLGTDFYRAYGSGSDYVGVQTEGSESIARAIPWVTSAGDVHFAGSLDSNQSASELDPLAWLGRSFDTSEISADPDGIETTYTEGTKLDQGATFYRVFEMTRNYAGGGTWTMNVATDVHDSPITPEEPYVGYGDFARDIELNDDIPALPADRDWQGVNVVNGVKGSIDGVPGEFTCAQGVSACWLEIGRGADAEGYHPYDNVVFTRDDNGATEALPAATTSQTVPTADYLVFGTWQYVPEDVSAVDEYDFGAFAGGGNPYWSFDAAANLSGTATYQGSAHGMYYTSRTSKTPSVGSFDALVRLEADFGGMVNPFDTGRLSGIVDNFHYDGEASGFPAQLTLKGKNAQVARILGIPLDFVGPQYAGTEGIFAVGVVSDEQIEWSGTWQAVFYGYPGNATDHPTGVAGTFGATKNDENGMVGAFGARR